MQLINIQATNRSAVLLVLAVAAHVSVSLPLRRVHIKS